MEPQFHIFQLLLTAFFAIVAAAATSTACNRTCNTITVPPPFGFSDACNIPLNCSRNSTVIGEFKVRNFTSESIILDVPFNCTRSKDALNGLFSKNFAPSRKNSFILRDCNDSEHNTQLCNIRNAILVDDKCSKSGGGGVVGNVSACYLNGTSQDTCYNRSILGIGCGVLYSSALLNQESNSPFVAELEIMELRWWLDKPCQCSKNAVNIDVSGTTGCSCQCSDGYEGDGFAGCRKKAKCSASKYLSGTCGGASRLVVLIGGFLGGAFIMACLVPICLLIRRRSSFQRKRKSMRRLLSQTSCTVPLYTYKEIEKATDSFSESQLLGTGAYGTVYAGKLNNDKLVAIKKIKNRDVYSIEQVMNEIKLLSSVNHPNLVRLLGCCIEGGEQILVYEYMPNGTLAQHLQRERGRAPLPWTIRLRIATETAKAIAYLHSVVHPPIYHRDIKSSNILLDFNYYSKVADFGLSRMGMTESSHVSTGPQGTPGYVDPQYHQNFHLSDKSDVYSFGVVLVEIITALKAVDFSREQTEVNLAALAINKIGKGSLDEIIDPLLDPHRDAWTFSSIHKVAELAFRCLAYHRDMRPSMIEVADELEQLRMSGWAPAVSEDSVFMSTASSLSSSPSIVTEKSRGTSSKSRRLVIVDTLEEGNVESPESVQDPWLSEQSSPSANSLLGSAAR